ncbi:MAG: hypothetical protein ACLQVL_37210 [Terriglobia bacterium]
MNITTYPASAALNAARRYLQSPNEKDRPIYDELCKETVQKLLEKADVFEKPFPFYFTPTVKDVHILVWMPSQYCEAGGYSGWFRGGTVTAKVQYVDSPTHATVWIDDEQNLFDISPWDVYWDSFPGREVILPEGCVKSLEEAQQSFADRRLY